MRRHLAILLAATLGGSLAAGALRAAEPDPKLAQQGYVFLKKYCYACHGVEVKKPPLKVLDRALLTTHKRKKAPFQYLVPGKPEESYLWQRVQDGEMPPEEVTNKPTEEEKKTFKAWIAAGARFPALENRSFKGEKSVLTDIFNHLQKTPSEDRKFQRYFTLTHLYNNPTLTEVDLRLYRAGLSKLVNSLSWKPRVVLPQAIDKEETVYSVDLRRLGWNKQANTPDLWREILKVYPYGLKHDEDPDKEIQQLAEQVYALAGTNLPDVRADWLIATASQPPLYPTLLQLPVQLSELEKKLQVNIEDNFRDDNLARAGLITSGVSRQNRLLERHEAAYGAYWKSYDFKSSGGKGNLLRFPLGPKFKNNPFEQQAFVQSGGEVLFNLPNGLQGYMLVDKDDRRIDRGPVAIVRDSNETGGTPEVVTGISCMNCHKLGIVSGFKDVLRTGSGVFGQARIKVERLHPKVEVMNKLVQEDEQRFVKALEEATGVFVKVAEDKDKDIAKFDDPIGAIAKLYYKDLDLAEVASELGIEQPKALQEMIRGNPKLKELGLGPLAEGAATKRELWEFLEGNSLFQTVANVCDLGTPVSVK